MPPRGLIAPLRVNFLQTDTLGLDRSDVGTE